MKKIFIAGTIFGIMISCVVLFGIFLDSNTRIIRWVNDSQSVQEFLTSHASKTLTMSEKTNGTKVLGAAIVGNNTCLIYAHRPKKMGSKLGKDSPEDREKLEIIGHELTHCFIDNLHD